MKKTLIIYLALLSVIFAEESNISIMEEVIGENIYMSYAKFIANKDGQQFVINAINSNNGAMKTKESLLKGMYQFYHIKNRDLGREIIHRVYDKNIDFIKNNINGVYVQGIYIDLGEYEIAKNIVTKEYCYTVDDMKLKKACLYNNMIIDFKLNGEIGYDYLFKQMYENDNNIAIKIFG